MKIRLSRPILSHLEGTGAWQHPSREGDDPAVPLVAKIMEARTRADGSVTVELDAAEAEILLSYVEVLEIGAADNAGDTWDRWDWGGVMGELNAARALIPKLAALIEEV